MVLAHASVIFLRNRLDIHTCGNRRLDGVVLTQQNVGHRKFALKSSRHACGNRTVDRVVLAQQNLGEHNFAQNPPRHVVVDLMASGNFALKTVYIDMWKS